MNNKKQINIKELAILKLDKRNLSVIPEGGDSEDYPRAAAQGKSNDAGEVETERKILTEIVKKAYDIRFKKDCIIQDYESPKKNELLEFGQKLKNREK